MGYRRRCHRSFRGWIPVISVGLIVFGNHPALGAAFDPSKSYNTVKTPHFAIHYAKELDPVAQRVAVVAEEVYGLLTPKYHWKPWGRTQVILTDNNDQANGAASVLPYNWLLLRVTAPSPASPLSTYDDWLRTLVMHEYTHILHMDQVGGVMRVPRLFLGKLVAPNATQPGWQREGIATYEETVETSGGRGRASFSEMLLRTATLNEKFAKIDQADGLGWRWPGSNAQYIYGEKFLKWLADTYGEEKLIAYERRVGRSPIFLMINHHAKKVWGKSFYKLWREWRDALKTTYAAERAAIEANGMTLLTPLPARGAALSAPVYSRDGRQMAYVAADYHFQPEIRVQDTATGAERVVRRKQLATQISFSPTGDQIAYSAIGTYKNFNNFYDIYVVPLQSGGVTRITVGRRATDPDFSPDGKTLVYVVNQAGTQRLALYDLEGKKETLLPIAVPDYTQYANPRWSPNGKWIAVSSWRSGGFRDIFLVRPDGTVVKQVTNDRALDLGPTWGGNSRRLYFTSDRSGIANVYRYDLKRHRVDQVTNVLTGVFEPTVAPDGTALIVQHYTGDGYDLQRIDLNRKGLPFSEESGEGGSAKSRGPAVAASSPEHAITEAPTGASELASPKKYHPFTGALFVPRFVSPNIIALDNGVLLSALTGGADPLRWHNWLAGVTYRTDANHVGYFGNYIYNRFLPVFDLGVNEYAVDFGNLTFQHTDGTLRSVHLFEKRLRGFAGVAYPWKKHRFSLQYFLEDRDNIPFLTAEERSALNLDRFGGLSFTYRYGTGERLPASVSTENGRRLRMNMTVTDKALGSNTRNEQQIFSGDYREYISLPWRHHVLATRLAGGITWGDQLAQGTFGVGGALGEGVLASGESFFYFPLRGLPVAALSTTRAMLMSLEYRVPLVSPQRGLGTWPFFLQNIHAAAFADYGNGWNAGQSTGKWFFDNFFLGTGAELRGDFVLGHGLPVSGRLGYGIIVVNRDRLGNLVDPLLKSAIKNGTFILQIGTSF